MSDPQKQLAEAVQRGYVVIRLGQTLVWKHFHTWCLGHRQPYVYVDLRRTDTYKGAAVGIELFTTTVDGQGGDRFTPTVLAAARQVLAAYPSVNPAAPHNKLRMTPISIRQGGVLLTVRKSWPRNCSRSTVA